MIILPGCRSPGLEQRGQRQDTSGGIAARTRHQPGPGYTITVQLRHPVDGQIKALRVGMLPAVPLPIHIRTAQPEIARKVDDRHIFFQQMHGHTAWIHRVAGPERPHPGAFQGPVLPFSGSYQPCRPKNGCTAEKGSPASDSLVITSMVTSGWWCNMAYQFRTGVAGCTDDSCFVSLHNDGVFLDSNTCSMASKAVFSSLMVIFKGRHQPEYVPRPWRWPARHVATARRPGVLVS